VRDNMPAIKQPKSREGRRVVEIDTTDVAFRSLKYTHASLLIKAVVPINVISSRVGHANPSIKHNIYAHLQSGVAWGEMLRIGSRGYL